nr:MAG TPA: antitoxin [Caudoviricetes sp.]
MKCVICGEKISGHGNNADPVKRGCCCDDCNLKVVVPERLKKLYATRKEQRK